MHAERSVIAARRRGVHHKAVNTSRRSHVPGTLNSTRTYSWRLGAAAGHADVHLAQQSLALVEATSHHAATEPLQAMH